MKVYEAIPENVAVELWLNGDGLNELHLLDFIPKTGKNPREEKTKNWRRRMRGHIGELSMAILYSEFGYAPMKKKYPIDKNYINSISDGYNFKVRNYHYKAIK